MQASCLTVAAAEIQSIPIHVFGPLEVPFFAARSLRYQTETPG
jgi:hypothetical protein